MTATEQVWRRVELLTDRAVDVAGLRFHRLQLVGAQRMRARGEGVPPALRMEERIAAVGALAVPIVLERVRNAYDGQIALIKGPELAARYPDPKLRPAADLDLLTDDAHALQRALLGAGFKEVGEPWRYVDIHHLRPLQLPGLPLPVEVHSAPKWPDGLRPPSSQELLGSARPGRVGVDALAPAEHTLVVAAHAWAHAPLGRLGHLLDSLLLALEADRGEVDALARRWGCERMWRATRAAAEALLLGTRDTAALRLWARHLGAVRERTVFEHHLEDWSGCLCGLPRRRAAVTAGGLLASRVRRDENETWRRKLYRTRRALHHAGLPKSEHDARLPPEDVNIGGLIGPAPQSSNGATHGS